MLKRKMMVQKFRPTLEQISINIITTVFTVVSLSVKLLEFVGKTLLKIFRMFRILLKLKWLSANLERMNQSDFAQR